MQLMCTLQLLHINGVNGGRVVHARLSTFADICFNQAHCKSVAREGLLHLIAVAIAVALSALLWICL